MNDKVISPATRAALDKLDSKLGVEVIDWLAGLYEKESGGFYYAESSRDNPQFFPDIESLVQAVILLNRMGLVENYPEGGYILPEEFRKKGVAFLDARQEEADGYFYDHQYREIANTAKKDRNTTFATWAYSGFRAKPPYALPKERLAKKSAPEAEKKSSSEVEERFSSEESFIRWLEEISVPTRCSYSWGSDLSSAAVLITASGCRPTLIKWLKEKQCPETGMWEKEPTPNGINGVLKLCGFFNEETEPFPNADSFIRNCVEISKTFSPRSGSEAWNPLGAMAIVLKSLGNSIPTEMQELVDSSIADIISNIADKIEDFRMPDGGYGYLKSGSSKVSNDVVVSLGKREGDVNGTSLIALIYRDAYALAGLEQPGLWKKYNAYFFEKLGFR